MSVIKNLLLISFFGFTLNGCSLSNSIWGTSNEIGEHPVYAENSNTDVIDKYDEDEKVRLMSQYIKEWEAIKPSLNKVVALESELSYVLKELEKVDSASLAPNLGNTMNEVPDNFLNNFDVDSPQELVGIGETESESRNGTSAENEKTLDKFSQSGLLEANSQQVALARAPQISKSLGDNKTEENLMDNKFSSIVQADSMHNASLVSPYQSAVEYTSSEENLCGQNKQTELGKGFAIHLASYSKYNSVSAGQKTFQAKYANKLCPKTAIVKAVKVKGSDFYSLRYGPYPSRDEAQQVCNYIRTGDDYCSISEFEGERVN